MLILLVAPVILFKANTQSQSSKLGQSNLKPSHRAVKSTRVSFYKFESNLVISFYSFSFYDFGFDLLNSQQLVLITFFMLSETTQEQKGEN